MTTGDPGRRGVALAGGGSRGAYQVGVWEAMRECGMEYGIVTGTSVGALNGAMMVQGDYEAARRMWNRITARDVSDVEISPAEEPADPDRAAYVRFMVQAVRAGGADISGLEHIMRSVVDQERFYASPVRYGLVTVKFPSFAPVRLAKEEIPPDKLCDYLIASASCFPAFPAKSIGKERFIDGAYYDNLPVNLAVSLGAREIVAVDLQAPGLRRRTKNKGIPITWIQPRHPLGAPLYFEPDSAARGMRLGYLDAMRAFGRAEGDYITLAAGQTAALEETLRGGLIRAAELTGVQPARTRRAGRFPRTVQRLAEWYGMEIEPLYTAQEFCYELLLRFNATDPLASEEIAADFSLGGGGRKTAERLAKYGRQRLTAHLYSRLRALSFGSGDPKELRRFAAVLKEETAAAFLLFALKTHLAGEEG